VVSSLIMVRYWQMSRVVEECVVGSNDFRLCVMAAVVINRHSLKQVMPDATTVKFRSWLVSFRYRMNVFPTSSQLVFIGCSSFLFFAFLHYVTYEGTTPGDTVRFSSFICRLIEFIEVVKSLKGFLPMGLFS
jgi:hypothetical protein